nr:hypothetical protein [Cytophagales bacterium]
MTLLDLERQSEELEQTLKKQLDIAKNDSGLHVKIAGIAIVSALVTFSVFRLTKKRSSAGRAQIEAPRNKKKYSFFTSLRKRLIWVALTYAKGMLIQRVGEKLKAASEKK